MPPHSSSWNHQRLHGNKIYSPQPSGYNLHLTLPGTTQIAVDLTQSHPTPTTTSQQLITWCKGQQRQQSKTTYPGSQTCRGNSMMFCTHPTDIAPINTWWVDPPPYPHQHWQAWVDTNRWYRSDGRPPPRTQLQTLLAGPWHTLHSTSLDRSTWLQWTHTLWRPHI